ncbi:transcription termination/antitermination protein NusG [Pararhizobium sp. DWP1-1-3]|uniref:transcription termination/antitermination protein NusG n=1 Tax=Pararhizobium sp. DWP1-1-3 TaxID=2804652 RepID=UPI003CF11273
MATSKHEDWKAMSWYAVQTVPGAQKPRREYVVERTGRDGEKPRGKGYRIVPNLNHEVSAIEKALTDNGFQCYMPAEKRLVRDRKHTDLWKVRRFALMVGYVFVREPHNWDLLKATYGVAGIVKDQNGRPMAIDIVDVMKIRSAEADSEVEFDRRSRLARQVLRKSAKTDPRLQMLIKKFDIAGTISVPLDIATIAA